MIERMSPDEAKIIKYLKGKVDIPYCNFNGNLLKGEGYRTIVDHATLLIDKVELQFPQNLNAYLANFISLGILIDMYGVYRSNEEFYNPIKERYRLKQLESQFVPNHFKSITVEKSYYKITDFGKLFIKACTK